MNFKTTLIFVLISIFTFSCNHNKNENKNTNKTSELPEKTKTLFELIPDSISKVKFSNTITENVGSLENLFNFDYFYNGAGVGIEDLNNDGLLDLFFCGNQVPNKLYINKGNFIFEDVSEKAGINQGKKWSNGVTFADLNNDGFKDIYVSQGGPNHRTNRNNLLFINNQDLTFTESAEKFNIADNGLSTQTAFFDFDKDGDLDCIVMNENELYGVDPVSLKKMINKDPQAKHFNSSHLYRNDDGVFKNITSQAGLERPIFGLGLGVADINNDNWLDIYIASDYYLPDALFINNKNGTFTEQIKEYTNHISFYGMGLDIADINNDNLQDIFTLDMASTDHFRAKTLMASMSTQRFSYLVEKEKFQHQYMYNSLQLNIGNNRYNNISHLTQTANTDWSWSVLMSDFDNDEDKDIYITNGYRRYALDNDLQKKVFNAKQKYGANVPLHIKQELYNQMPSEKLSNILYKNDGNLKFNDNSKAWGLDNPSFSNGAATADLDNDGDLDLIVNNIDEKAFVYKNTTREQQLGNYLKIKPIGKTSESFAKIKIAYNGKSQFIETKRVRGYMSSQETTAHFGLGKEAQIDTVSIQWANGKTQEKYNVKTNNTIEFFEKEAVTKSKFLAQNSTTFKKNNTNNLGLYFKHKENIYDDFEQEILLPYKQSNLGPFITKGDLNADGKDDIFIGGASGQAGAIFISNNTGFRLLKSKTLEEDSGYEDMESTFFDFDNDGDLDIYVVSGGNAFEANSSYYTDRIYLNDGSGAFTKYLGEELIKNPKSGKSVTTIDFDKDGDLDILVGNRVIPKNYPKFSSSILYENQQGKLKNVTKEIAAELETFGIVNSIISTDFNSDGWQDFITVGEWSTIGFFENKNGKFTQNKTTNSSKDKTGWWYTIKETDVNNDNFPDYIVGNSGLNLKHKASTDKPFKVYATDFDGNGTNDIVLSTKYRGEYVPVRGRECSSQQMPFIENKYKSYADFAGATLSDIYGENLKTSYKAEVTTFESILLINKGNGSFETKNLPIEAQQFPIVDIAFYDFNNDGYEDALVGGNIYETEVETPRLDALSGIILISNQKNGYKVLNNLETGLYPKGNIKSFEIVKSKNKQFLIYGMNNDNVKTYILTDN